MSSVIPKDFKDCSKFPFLTKEIVYNEIKKNVHEWEASHDYWYSVTKPFLNACSGYDVNVIGDEYSKVGRDTFKVVVYALYFNEEAQALEVDYNDVIFVFLIEGENTEYKFEKYSDAERFLESMPELFTNWDSMTKSDFASYIIQCDTKRNIMCEYDCDVFDLECEMREASFVLAKMVIENEHPSSSSFDALVSLIKNELCNTTPTRDELHLLVKKYYGDADDLNEVIKSVECEVCFSMDVGVLAS